MQSDELLSARSSARNAGQLTSPTRRGDGVTTFLLVAEAFCRHCGHKRDYAAAGPAQVKISQSIQAGPELRGGSVQVRSKRQMCLVSGGGGSGGAERSIRNRH